MLIIISARQNSTNIPRVLAVKDKKQLGIYLAVHVDKPKQLCVTVNAAGSFIPYV